MSLFRLANHDEHPSDPHWVVFRFGDRELADEFTGELDKAAITYERDTEGPPYLVAVRRRQREEALRLNYLVLGRHRDPIIPDRRLGWAIVAFVGIMLILAFIGWLRR